MDPEVRLLRYFLAVAKELNFTRAAEQLHVSQPSLSAQIRQLETQLGVPLLRRTTRTVSLTEAGETLLDRGPHALGELQRAWQAARDAGRGTVGTLRLAYTLSTGHDTTPHVIEALQRAHPGIDVITDLMPTPRVVKVVREGQADAGVARTPAPEDGIRLVPLRRDREGILVSADHPLAAADTVTLRQVAGFPIALHPRAANPYHHDLIHDLFLSRGLQPSFLERDITFDLSQRFITDGSAVAIVGRSTVAGVPGDLRWIPLAEPIAITVALVLPAQDASANAVRLEQVALAHAGDQHWLD